MPPLFTSADVRNHNHPSSADGISESVEMEQLAYGADRIQQMGILLRLPQVTMCSAQILLHRFYVHRSLAEFDVKKLALAAIFLASKIEETPKNMRDVINVFHRLEELEEAGAGTAVRRTLIHHDSELYKKYKAAIITYERHLLLEFGFHLHVEHPYKYLAAFVNLLGGEPWFCQVAWNCINDICRSRICVLYPPEVISSAAVYAAARLSKVVLPESPPWWTLFGTSMEDIRAVCAALGVLYEQKKPVYRDLRDKPADFPGEGAISECRVQPGADHESDPDPEPKPKSKSERVPSYEPISVPEGVAAALALAQSVGQSAAEARARAKAEAVFGTDGRGGDGDDDGSGSGKRGSSRDGGSRRDRDSRRRKRSRNRDRDRDRESGRDRDRESGRDRDRESGRDRDRESGRDRDRGYRDRDRGRDRHRDRDIGRGRDGRRDDDL